MVGSDNGARDSARHSLVHDLNFKGSSDPGHLFLAWKAFYIWIYSEDGLDWKEMYPGFSHAFKPLAPAEKERFARFFTGFLVTRFGELKSLDGHESHMLRLLRDATRIMATLFSSC